MSFLPTDIFEEMERMRREIDRILDETRLSAWTFPFSKISFLPGLRPRAYPLLNVAEDKDNYYVDALAPGIEPKSLNVSVVKNQLVISGEKEPLPQEVKPESIHRSERSAGRFARSLALSADVDIDKVQANYVNGMLRIILPKQEAAKPRQIPVNVG